MSLANKYMCILVIKRSELWWCNAQVWMIMSADVRLTFRYGCSLPCFLWFRLERLNGVLRKKLISMSAPTHHLQEEWRQASHPHPPKCLLKNPQASVFQSSLFSTLFFFVFWSEKSTGISFSVFTFFYTFLFVLTSDLKNLQASVFQSSLLHFIGGGGSFY